MSKRHIAIIAGARPNFMKVGPLMKQLANSSFRATLIHTGQHYDAKMSDIFFTQLDIPKPDVSLGVGSGTHAEQTGKVMMAFESYCNEARPDLVVVVGDVNSTLACSLVAAKANIPVAHLEAGLRSRDWTMPEEINRLVTDRLSALLLTPSQDADENLLAEGASRDSIHFVGNAMIDTLLSLMEKIDGVEILPSLEVEPRQYAVGTFHRPANVDSEEKLTQLTELWRKISEIIPLVLPLHPRSKAMIGRFGLLPSLEKANLRIIDPLGYLEFTHLNKNARFVITDSGGVQEETTVLGIPCLTYRENTERPVTITHGTNILVGTDPVRAFEAVGEVLEREMPVASAPPLWDGKTAERCVAVFEDFLG
ncbi:MAG: UDP-N-acetylglucosamine 2-epimerase (non-hydrolyzing) [Bdellovibrionales bacterium]|nr:UDP-N-acetylglucosamine 2-epimerase (non-hydrolyzing) [Bdellovibrionales bacterium]